MLHFIYGFLSFNNDFNGLKSCAADENKKVFLHLITFNGFMAAFIHELGGIFGRFEWLLVSLWNGRIFECFLKNVR
jgi:hypothetical protein